MTAQFSINPNATTNAAGSFNVQSRGLIVGTAYPDPSTRFALSGGILATTETLPMFGGVGIGENIPGAGAKPTDSSLGGTIVRATGGTNLTGFSVFDQNYSAINAPESPVPQTLSGGLVNFYRLGSGARVALAIDPSLASLEGGLITQQVSWDFTNQRVIAFDGTALPVKILLVDIGNSWVPVYNAGTGFVTWNMSGSACVALI
jgi:hypothetical protein